MIVNLKEAFASAKTPAEIRAGANIVTEAIRKGEIDLKKVSIKNLAEATLGYEALSRIAKMNDEAGALVQGLQEAVDPVNLSAFTNITGQLIVRQGYEAYQNPEFIGTQLVTEETDNQDNVRVAGLAPIDDAAMDVAENEEYPNVKFGEDYIDRPQTKKKGLRMGLTREMIFFDQTGKLGEKATELGYRLGLSKEKRILRTVLGIDNTFKRKGVARNTYVASADPRINANLSLALTDWATFDSIYQMIAAYTDDRTVAEPIDVTLKQMLVGPALRMTADRLINAGMIRQGSQTANVQTYGPNPVPGMQVFVSPWVTWLLVNEGSVSATPAAARYHVGDFKRAFRYVTLFPFQMVQATNHPDEFNRDVLLQWKCSERGTPYTYAPWYALKLGNG